MEKVFKGFPLLGPDTIVGAKYIKRNEVYLRTLKHRVLKKHKKLTHEALLINEVLDKLQSL